MGKKEKQCVLDFTPLKHMLVLQH